MSLLGGDPGLILLIAMELPPVSLLLGSPPSPVNSNPPGERPTVWGSRLIGTSPGDGRMLSNMPVCFVSSRLVEHSFLSHTEIDVILLHA